MMYRTLMSAKLHRARVTEANLNYVGSVTIDEDLLDAVGMMANEKVQIVNNNNGARLETYIIPGERGAASFVSMERPPGSFKKEMSSLLCPTR